MNNSVCLLLYPLDYTSTCLSHINDHKCHIKSLFQFHRFLGEASWTLFKIPLSFHLINLILVGERDSRFLDYELIPSQYMKGRKKSSLNESEKPCQGWVSQPQRDQVSNGIPHLLSVTMSLTREARKKKPPSNKAIPQDDRKVEEIRWKTSN